MGSRKKGKKEKRKKEKEKKTYKGITGNHQRTFVQDDGRSEWPPFFCSRFPPTYYYSPLSLVSFAMVGGAGEHFVEKEGCVYQRLWLLYRGPGQCFQDIKIPGCATSDGGRNVPRTYLKVLETNMCRRTLTVRDPGGCLAPRCLRLVTWCVWGWISL